MSTWEKGRIRQTVAQYSPKKLIFFIIGFLGLQNIVADFCGVWQALYDGALTKNLGNYSNLIVNS
jgi:hypothetical protein